MATETRLSPVYSFKQASIDSAGLFRGYASTFNGPVDSFGDIIAPGAFVDTLQKHKSDGTSPALLWSHSQSDVIGKWHTLEEDSHGLKAVGKLTLETAKGKEAYALMKDQALGLSIGFAAVKSKYDRASKTNTLSKIKLFEVSLVGIAANPAAKITHVKSGISTVREYEDAIRDVLGYSRRESKKLAGGGWPAFAERDVSGEQELTEMVRAIDARTIALKSIFKGK